jgi:hypothetical protein
MLDAHPSSCGCPEGALRPGRSPGTDVGHLQATLCSSLCAHSGDALATSSRRPAWCSPLWNGRDLLLPRARGQGSPTERAPRSGGCPGRWPSEGVVPGTRRALNSPGRTTHPPTTTSTAMTLTTVATKQRASEPDGADPLPDPGSSGTKIRLGSQIGLFRHRRVPQGPEVACRQLVLGEGVPPVELDVLPVQRCEPLNVLITHIEAGRSPKPSAPSWSSCPSRFRVDVERNENWR